MSDAAYSGSARNAQCLDTVKPGDGPPQRMRDIIADVAKRHGLSVDDLIGRARDRRVAWPRQEFMWLAHQVRRPNLERRHSTTAIGAFLDGRDHTTVVYGIREHAKRWNLSDRVANDQ